MNTLRTDFRTRYGAWALVAGGSDGIGAEFARQLAQHGLNVLLVGRRPAPLHTLAAELTAAHPIEARAIPCDLSDRGAVDTLVEQSRSLDIGLVVCNAAMSVIGPFLEQPADSHDRMLELNCRSPLALALSFGRRMKAAGRGGIIFLSSMAGFVGTALSAHYAATKAYARVLAEGLWAELRPFGVDVIASCPGTVRTPTFLKDDPVSRRWASLPVVECGLVVRDTLRALGKRPIVVPGLIDRAAALFMQRAAPRRLLIALTERTMQAMYPHLVSAGSAHK